MAEKQTFKVLLEKHPTLNATGITIPFDVEAEFGAKRVPVKATVNGSVYRGSIVKMGGKYMLGIPKEFRDRAKIAAGDYIVVTVEQDTKLRKVDTPKDLAKALVKNKTAKEKWDKLSYSHKKEYAREIEAAKQPETRARRIEKTIEMLAAGGKK